MYVHGDTYLTTISKTLAEEAGHFIVWDEVGGSVLAKVEHFPLYNTDGRVSGVHLIAETKLGEQASHKWTSWDRRNTEVHGHHSFLLEVGALVGRLMERHAIVAAEV